MSNLIIGSHVSCNKKNGHFTGSVHEAVGYDANALMFYIGAPQNVRRFSISPEQVSSFHEALLKFEIPLNNVCVHAPYIVNLATPEKHKREFAKRFLKEEIGRCSLLGVKYMILHPGSYTTGSLETGRQFIVDSLNEILDPSQNVQILLETMAGKGTEVGTSFVVTGSMVDAIHHQECIGVCLDTCHTHDAGYDYDNPDKILELFENSVGLEKLKIIHLNDSKNPRGAHRDRHENLGYGHLGFDRLHRFAHHPFLKNIPKILETPWINGRPPYKEEIAMLRSGKWEDIKSQNFNSTQLKLVNA